MVVNLVGYLVASMVEKTVAMMVAMLDVHWAGKWVAMKDFH